MSERALPLAGKTVVVTRPKEQAGQLMDLLEQNGATPWLLPLIYTTWEDDLAPVDHMLYHLSDYDAILFTSVNGVKYFFERARMISMEKSALACLGRLTVIAVGPKTAAALRKRGLSRVHFPDIYRQEGIIELLGRLLPPNSRLVYPRAREVRSLLLNTLREQGYLLDDVVLYRTSTVKQVDPAMWRAILDGRVDVVTFTSSSSIKAFDRFYRRRDLRDINEGANGEKSNTDLATTEGKLRLPFVLACLGPPTANEARDLGYQVDVVAREHTTPGLIKALNDYFMKSR